VQTAVGILLVLVDLVRKVKHFGVVQLLERFQHVALVPFDLNALFVAHDYLLLVHVGVEAGVVERLAVHDLTLVYHHRVLDPVLREVDGVHVVASQVGLLRVLRLEVRKHIRIRSVFEGGRFSDQNVGLTFIRLRLLRKRISVD